MMQIPGRRQRKKERGQGLLEFALMLPIILLLMMAVMDFGRMLFLYSQVSNAAREAARFGSVVGTDPTNPQFIDCTGIRNAGEGTVALPLVNFDPATDIIIEYDDGQSVYAFTCDDSPNEDDLARGDRVRVTINAEIEFLTPLISAFTPGFSLSFTSARTILRGGVRVPPGVG